VSPVAIIRTKGRAALRFLWQRSLEVKGVRDVLLATVPPALRALRRLRGEPRARAQTSAPVDVLVSPERFVPEFQSDVPWARAHLERYSFAAERLFSADTVLDAACGSGYGTAILSRSCRRVTGIDKSPAAIAYAREKYNGAFYVRSLLRRFPTVGKYDVVVSFETIEHIAAPLPKVLRGLACRARRMVIGSVPYLESEGNPFHRHFHLHEGHLRTLERYGSVAYYFQEPEPGYRIYSYPLPKIQNLVFILTLNKRSRWIGRVREGWKDIRPSHERAAREQVAAPSRAPQVSADDSSIGPRADSARASGTRKDGVG